MGVFDLLKMKNNNDMENLVFDEMAKADSNFYFKHSIIPNFNNQKDEIVIEKKGFAAICGTKKSEGKDYYLTSDICNDIYKFVTSNVCTLISISLKRSPSNILETGQWTNYDIKLNGMELHIISGINTLTKDEKDVLHKLYELCNNVSVNGLLKCVNKTDTEQFSDYSTPIIDK